MRTVRPRRSLLVCIPIATAALVGCLLKPTSRAHGDDGGTGDSGGKLADGSGSSKSSDGSQSATCNAQPIDPFDGSMTPVPCGTGASEAGGTITATASGFGQVMCRWNVSSLAGGVLVEVPQLSASGITNYAGFVDLEVQLNGEVLKLLRLTDADPATSFTVATGSSPAQQVSLAMPVWLLFQVVDDHTLAAKYLSGPTLDPDLGNWTFVENEVFSANATQKPAAITLLVKSDGNGSGSTTANLSNFDTCK